MPIVLGNKATGNGSGNLAFTTSSKQVLTWAITRSASLSPFTYDGQSITTLRNTVIAGSHRAVLAQTLSLFTVTNGVLARTAGDWSAWVGYGLTGVKDTSTQLGYVTAAPGYQTSYSITVSGLSAGCLAMSAINHGDDGTTPFTCTVGGSDALDGTFGFGVSEVQAAAHWIATGTSVQFDWGWGGGGSRPITAVFAVGIPPAAGNNAIWFFFQRQQKFLQDLKRGLVPPDLLRKRYQEVYAI